MTLIASILMEGVYICCTKNMTQILNLFGKKVTFLNFIESLASPKFVKHLLQMFMMFFCGFTIDDYIIQVCYSKW